MKYTKGLKLYRDYLKYDKITDEDIDRLPYINNEHYMEANGIIQDGVSNIYKYNNLTIKVLGHKDNGNIDNVEMRYTDDEDSYGFLIQYNDNMEYTHIVSIEYDPNIVISSLSMNNDPIYLDFISTIFDNLLLINCDGVIERYEKNDINRDIVN